MVREEDVTKIGQGAGPKKARAFPAERWSSLRLPLPAQSPSSRNGGCGRHEDERDVWQAMPEGLRILDAFVSRTLGPTRPEFPLAGWPGRSISAYGIESRRAAGEFAHGRKGNPPISRKSLP